MQRALDVTNFWPPRLPSRGRSTPGSAGSQNTKTGNHRERAGCSARSGQHQLASTKVNRQALPAEEIEAEEAINASARTMISRCCGSKGKLIV
jgi:hypothetical protein